MRLRSEAPPVQELTSSLASLVAARADEQPEAVAIEDGERRLTYAELDNAASAIATGLQAAGVEAEEPVAVCLPRSWQAICAFMGIPRAGAAYVPLNPAYPRQRQRRLLELAGARLALTSPIHSSRLPPRVTALDVEALARSGVNGAQVTAGPGGETLAYVLFTSGSTGTPKGVEVTHGNLVNLLRSSADIVPRPTDTVLQVVPLEFDVSGLEIWGALLNGARLVVAPRGRPDPIQLGRLIEERGVTMLAISTGLLHELVHSALPALRNLRLIVALGDVLSPSAAAKLRSAHPNVRLLNGYGPTEATIAASSYEITSVDGGPVPIGRELPGYRLYVLDPSGSPVPPEEPGELWIGGAGAARGYRGDPERTRERFRDNPFDDGRMYRTGDRARLRSDGELLFLGRLDHQVKIDGQRVEPGEVEHSLAGHPDVYEAAVVAREDVPGHKRLVGYVALRSGGRATAEDLRRHVASELPAFMVPRPIVLLNTLPRNERGKIDRSLLPAPERGQAADVPLDPHPASVARAMAEVLQLESVGADEDFFDLGGTSLLAIQLAGRLRQRLRTGIDMGAVFEERTARRLSDRITRQEQEAPDLRPLIAGPPERTAPLSAAQRRAWLFGRLHPESIAYQFASIFRFEGALDEAALSGALEDLLERHKVLRTSFSEEGEEPVQTIHAACRPRLERVDLRGEGHGAWPRLARARVRTQIDAAEPPLVRWTLARLGEESWALLHVEHHLTHDGWSFAVLAGELAELYSARVDGRWAELPDPVVQFQDYARWEQAVCGSEMVQRQIAHWARVLDPDPPLLELPTGGPRPARESFAGGSIRRRVGSDLTERLRSLAREHRATLFMVSLAAFIAQLQRYSGRDDLQVGSGLANRREPSSERLLGMIVNTVAMRCDVGGDPGVGELIGRVRDVALDAYANADAPFEAVVKALAPQRHPARSPLIQTLFSFHDSPRARAGWRGIEAQLVQGLPNGTAKADLNVIGIPEEDGSLMFVWEHSDLISDAAADRIAGHHVRLLEQLVERPEARLSELEILSDDEHRELAAWNSTPGSYDREASVHGLVEAQARAKPDAIAVIDRGERLSYGALIRRAGAVAASLRDHGVSPGDRVGILLNRSADSVVAHLGVLTAGAAYVPLDPLHPPTRIARALADADATAVLTDSTLRRRLSVGVAVLEVAEAAAGEPLSSTKANPEDLAYIIYTSGSTGEPKGVEVTHGNVVRLVDGADYAEMGPGVVMLHAASPAFDAATLEIWGPLANGGTVACLGEQPSPDAVAEAIEEFGVTTLWLTAGLFHELVDRRPDCLAAIRQLLAGGDVLSPDHVRRALAALPPESRLTNGYGPTETTTFATTHDMRPSEPVDGPVPIGRPIQGTACHVLDASGREVPVGVPGELAIGGDGVSRGYRGDPELTAARFRPDPQRPGERVYMTGDRVRRRPDGALEVFGRLDRQVKVRGLRVEPAEVENVLRSHEAVGDAAVIPFERAAGDLALAAYVVAKPGSTGLDAAALRAHTTAHLPAAMVPTAWVALPELPLTANGKLDRDRLPAPGPQHLVADSSGARPRSRAERKVVRCFEEMLGVRPVGIEDDFFALGGHSLLAVALFAELERIGGRRLPLSTIFEATTPRALAACLGSDAPASRWDNLVALKPHGSRPPLFVVATGDGNIVGFAHLARRFSAEQPLYALQPSGLDGRRPLDHGIEAMAKRYLSALRRVQPHGPYLLAGRCNGATVAFEMAQCLRAEGEDVPLLAALDSDPPPAKPHELTPGVPYDPIMEVAWVRAQEDGADAPDLAAPNGPAELAAWLRAEAAPGISRYLHEAWRWRDDLRKAWPDPLGADAPSLAEWAWKHGLDELHLAPALLLPVALSNSPLPDGGSWDSAMDEAWWARGCEPPDPLSPQGWDSFRAHLLDPLAGGRVNRYLLGAWNGCHLQEAFPDPLGTHAEGLLHWAWRHGVEEGLQARLLPPPPWPLSRRARLGLRLAPAPARAARAAERASRLAREAAVEVRARSIEALERWLDRPLPGARERIERHVVAAARQARATYRADPWPGRVLLVTSNEFADKPAYPAWSVRARGGVDRRQLPVGHVEMLREPGAALLARCLEEGIAEALKR